MSCGKEPLNSKVEYTMVGSGDVQLPCMLPALRSAILSPMSMGHVHDTASNFLPWLFLIFVWSKSVQVEAAHSAKAVSLQSVSFRGKCAEKARPGIAARVNAAKSSPIVVSGYALDILRAISPLPLHITAVCT